MVTGCRWREHERNDSIFPQFSSGSSSSGGSAAPFPPSPHPRLESEGMAPSKGHQDRIDRMFERFFPHLAAQGVAFEYRWGGLQCFTADDLPIVGAVTETGRLHTLAGLCGKGNGFSDVLSIFLAARVAGAVSEVEKRFGSAFLERYFAVDREGARWSATTGVKQNGRVMAADMGAGGAIGEDYFGA